MTLAPTPRAPRAPRTHKLTVRVTEREATDLRRLADLAGCSVAHALRTGGLEVLQTLHDDAFANQLVLWSSPPQ